MPEHPSEAATELASFAAAIQIVREAPQSRRNRLLIADLDSLYERLLTSNPSDPRYVWRADAWKDWQAESPTPCESCGSPTPCVTCEANDG